MKSSTRHKLFGLFSVSLALFLLGPLRQLVAFALDRSGTIDSSHILLIPFITAALLFFNRRRVFSDLQVSAVPAAIVWVAGAAFYYAGRTYSQALAQSDYMALMAGAVITFWLGGFLLFYGTAAFKAGLFPLLFLSLAVPIPADLFHGVARWLQYGSAEMVSAIFTLTRTPAFRDGFVFLLPGLTIEVAEECSGIRSTLGIFIVTLLAGHLLLRSKWKKTALLLAVIPISLFKNAVRIATLSLLAIHWDKGFITGRLHHEGGIVFMMIGLGLIYPLLAVLVKSEGKLLVSGVRS